MDAEELKSLIEALSQIEEEDSVPKTAKARIKNAVAALQNEEGDMKFKANKALHELDEMSDDPNIPSYIKPQIWNVVSTLESV